MSAANPCPICGKSDWCAVSADGAFFRCQRVEQGAFKTATDKNGTPYYLHRTGGAGARPAAELPPVRGGAEAKRADAAALDAAYQALLAQLVLSQSHRDNLRHRGLTEPEIDRRLYRSLTIQGRARIARELAQRFGAEGLLSVPGFIVKDKDGNKYLTIAGSAGLLIPCRDENGRIVALKVRRDGSKEELEEKNQPHYSYISSAKYGGPGPGSPVHVPLGIQAPAERVRLTEGELKADAAYILSGTPIISAPGVSAWNVCVPVFR